MSNDSAVEQVQAGIGWVPVPVFTGGIVDGIVSGDGRGDGTARLYATHTSVNTLKEFTFDGSWTNTTNISLPFVSYGALLLTDGRGDGSEHLYVEEFLLGGNTLEFTWDGVSWTPLALGAAGQQLIGAAVGDARGDGVKRVYSSGGFGVIEFTHQ